MNAVIDNMTAPAKRTIRAWVIAIALLVTHGQANAQTLLGGWTFDGLAGPTATAGTTTPRVLGANLGVYSSSANVYADGTSGSSSWTATSSTGTTELDSYGGTTLNDPRATTSGDKALGMVYRGTFKSEVFKLPTTGYRGITFSWDLRRSSTGPTTVQLAASTDGITFTDVGSTAAPAIDGTFYTYSRSPSGANVPFLYLRLTGGGTATSGGTYRIDNIQIKSSDSTWFGGASTDYGATANWVAPGLASSYSTVPTAGAFVVFQGSPANQPTIGSTPQTVGRLTSLSGTAGITLSGSATLTLTNGIVNNSANLLTVNPPVTNNNQNLNISGSGPVTLAGAVSGTGALTNAGTGAKTTLNAVNTYTGGTTVNSGTLEIGASGSIKGSVTVNNPGVLQTDNAGALETTAAVTLPASPNAGAANLNFAGTQTINALNFGAVSKAIGTWGAVGSSAAHQNAAFTGTGLLNVTAGGANPATTLDAVAAVCDGTASSFTAHVTGGASPSGNVEFFDGAASLGTAPLSGGNASKSAVLSLAGSPHSTTARYLGDDNNNQSTSSAQLATVNAAPGTTAITPSSSVATNQLGVQYTASGGTVGSTYLWTVTGGTIQGSSTTQTITVNWGNGTPQGNLTVAETTAPGGCTQSPISQNIAITGNTAPLADSFTLNVMAGNEIRVEVVQGKPGYRAYDPDGTITSLTVGAPGADATTWTENGTTIVYKAGKNHATGTDGFTYAVGDNGSPQGTAVGTVTVNVSAGTGMGGNVVGYAYDSGSGDFTVIFAGIPGFDYGILRNTGSGWSQITSKTASTATGLFTNIDSTIGNPSALYRSVYPKE